MKTLKNIKNYSLGFVVGVACVSSIAYGASNGSIGGLFNYGNLDGSSNVWRLNGVNIQDGTVGTSELGTDSVDSSKILNGTINQLDVENGYVNLSTVQNIGGTKTFTDILNISRSGDIKMSFIDNGSSGLGQIQQGSSALVLASNNNLTLHAGSDLANGSPSGQAVVIRTSGDVGIGTSSPAYKLDIAGQTRATGGFIGNVTGDVTGNISGNAGTVTNGVYTIGDQTIGGIKTFSSMVNLPGAPTAWYNLNVGSIGSTTTYAYSALCAQNSSGICTGNGGVVLGISNSNAGINLATSGNSFVNTGNFGIGNNSPAYRLDVTGQARATGGFIGNLTGDVTGNVSGNAGTVTNGVYTVGNQTIGGVKTFSSKIYAGDGINADGTRITAGEFIYQSDRRFKNNIETIKDPLQTVQALRGVTWNWKRNDKFDMGFIAQEAEEVLPELVYTNEDGYKGVQYGNMVGLLVEAVKEQQKQIDELNAKLNALQK